MSEPKNGSFVTLRELNDKLDKMRWETRFLILAGLIGTKFIPVSDVANAAVHLVK